MILLVDIGNTRIKWATLENNALVQQQAVAHATWTLAGCDRAFGALAQPSRVVIANVGGDRVGAIVRDVVLARWGVEPELIHSTTEAGGVRNAYGEAWKLGVDRWLAMIAALSIHRCAVCVVSIGTAATVDGVDATGRHLGGLIVPGPQLMVDSLLKNTSEIARRTQNGSIGLGLFADNTLGAVHQGALHSIAALAVRAVEAMRAEIGSQPMLVLTGGAAADVGQLIRVPHVCSPDLVLRGLAVIATGIAPSSSPGGVV